MTLTNGGYFIVSKQKKMFSTWKEDDLLEKEKNTKCVRSYYANVENDLFGMLKIACYNDEEECLNLYYNDRCEPF